MYIYIYCLSLCRFGGFKLPNMLLVSVPGHVVELGGAILGVFQQLTSNE